MFSRLHQPRSTPARLFLLVLVTVLLTVVTRPCLMLLSGSAAPSVAPATHALHHPTADSAAPCPDNDNDCTLLATIEKYQPAKRAIVMADGLHLPVLALLCWLLPLLLLRRLWRVLIPPIPLPDRLPPPLRFRVLLI